MKTKVLAGRMALVCLAVLLGVALASTAVASPRRPGAKNRNANAVKSLRAKYGQVFEVQADSKGVVRRIFGKNGARTTPYPGEPVKAAKTFVAENAELFGLKQAGKELKPIFSRETVMGDHVRFAQLHKGVPVWGVELAVHRDTKERVAFVTNGLYTGRLSVKTVPSITEYEALVIAEDDLNRTIAFGRDIVELYVLPGGDGRLAYRVILGAYEPMGRWQYFIDAHTGEVISSRDIMFHQSYEWDTSIVAGIYDPDDIAADDYIFFTNTASATVYDPNEVFDPAKSVVQLRFLGGQEEQRGEPDEENPFGTLDAPAIPFYGVLFGRYITVDNESTLAPAYSPSGNFHYPYDEPGDHDDYKDPRFAEVMAYYHLTEMHQYVSWLGFSAVNQQMGVSVESPAMPLNAAYAPPDGPIIAGTVEAPPFPRFHSFATDATIMLHEYGHAIIDDVRPLLMSPMGYRFHEGLADYIAASRSDNPVVMASLDNLFEGVDPSRDASDFKKFPDNLRSENHEDGRIISSALWDLRQALGSRRTDTLVLAALYYLYTPPNDPQVRGTEEGVGTRIYYNMRYWSLLDTLQVADEFLTGGQYRYVIRDVFADHGITDYLDDEWEFFIYRDQGRYDPYTTDRESWKGVYQPMGQTVTGTCPDTKYYVLHEGATAEFGITADPPDIILMPNVGGPAMVELTPGSPGTGTVVTDVWVDYEDGARMPDSITNYGSVSTAQITDSTPGVTLTVENAAPGFYFFNPNQPSTTDFSTPEYEASLHIQGTRKYPELMSYLGTAGDFAITVPGQLRLGNAWGFPTYAGWVDSDLYPPGVHSDARLTAVARGGTLPVWFMLANWGHEPVESYKVRFMMGGYVLDEIQMPALDKMKTTYEAPNNFFDSVNLIIPNDMPFGVYSVGAIIDPDDEIAECIEVNNELTSYDWWAQYQDSYNFLVWVVPPGGAQAITPFAFINSTNPPIPIDYAVLTDPVTTLPVADVAVSYSSNVPVSRWYVGVIDKLSGTYIDGLHSLPATTTSYSFTGLPNGVYELLVSGRATDTQWLIAARKGFTVATTQPVVQIVAGPSGAYFSPTATFHWMTDQPGIMKEYFFRLFPNEPGYTKMSQSEADPATGFLNTTFNNVPDGTHTFVVTGRDIYGNFTKSARRTFIVMGANVPPEVEIVAMFRYDTAFERWDGNPDGPGEFFVGFDDIDWNHPLETVVNLIWIDEPPEDPSIGLLEPGNMYIVVAATEPVRDYYYRITEWAPDEGGGDGGGGEPPTAKELDQTMVNGELWNLVRKDPYARSRTNVIHLTDLPPTGLAADSNIFLFQVIARDTDGNLQPVPTSIGLRAEWLPLEDFPGRTPWIFTGPIE